MKLFLMEQYRKTYENTAFYVFGAVLVRLQINWLDWLKILTYFPSCLIIIVKSLQIHRDYDHHRQKPYKFIGIYIIIVKNPINS